MPARLQLPLGQKTRLIQAVSRFPSCRVLVIGDLMLDRYWFGEVSRISPEAPVPVVEVREESQLLGGSANVAHNVASLGGQALVTGVIGNDFAGQELMRLFDGIAVPTTGLIPETGRPTTVKTRIIARHQQVVRFDREWRAPLKQETEERLISFIK